MVDIAYLGIAVDSSQSDKAAGSLKQLSGAAKQAEVASRGHTAAANQNSTANSRNAAASKANAVAQVELARASRMAAFQQRMLAFQMNDVFVSLASGMNPMMVAIQQGSQMAQVYSGEGGLGRALKESALMVGRLLTRFPLLTVATATLGAGFLGMAHEIEQATGKSVSFGDVVVATMKVARDGIANLLQPAIAAIGPWFSQTWDSVVAGVKVVGNTIMGTFAGALAFVKSAWGDFPNVMGDIGIRAAQSFLDAMTTMARDFLATINSMIAKVNGFLRDNGSDFQFGSLGSPNKLIERIEIENPYAGAADNPLKAFNEAFNVDRMGNFYEAIKANVIAGLEETEEAAGAAGKAINAAANDNIDPWKNLRNVTQETTDQFQDARQGARSFFGDIVNGFREGKNAAEVFTTALTNLANRFMDRGLDMLANALFPIPGNAMGTSNWRGGLSWVGEQGPEIVNLPRGSQVIPNHDIGRYMQAANGNGGGTVVNIQNYSGQQVTQSKRQGPGGTEILDVMIGKSIAGGKQDKAMAGRFGTRPQALGVG